MMVMMTMLWRPKSSGVHRHDVNTRSRLVLFMSVMLLCRQSLQPGILVSTSMPASPWGPRSSTLSERVLQHCARSVACDGLFLSTPCWHWSENWSLPSWISVTRSLSVPLYTCSPCWMPPLGLSTRAGRQNTQLHCYGSFTGYASLNESSSGCVFWRTIVCIAPAYLSDSLRPTSEIVARRCLRSADTMTLQVPSTCRATLGDHAFPVAAACHGSLPLETRACSSLLTFRRETKSPLIRHIWLTWRRLLRWSADVCIELCNSFRSRFCKVAPQLCDGSTLIHDICSSSSSSSSSCRVKRFSFISLQNLAKVSDMTQAVRTPDCRTSDSQTARPI